MDSSTEKSMKRLRQLRSDSGLLQKEFAQKFGNERYYNISHLSSQCPMKRKKPPTPTKASGVFSALFSLNLEIMLG